MFERIRCYIGTKKMDKFAKGNRRLGEIINNDDIVQAANDCLAMNRKLRKLMWHDREKAKDFNQEMIKKGFF